MKLQINWKRQFSWTVYSGCAVLAAYFLISRGVGVLPVVAGLALAGLFTWRMNAPKSSVKGARS